MSWLSHVCGFSGPLNWIYLVALHTQCADARPLSDCEAAIIIQFWGQAARNVLFFFVFSCLTPLGSSSWLICKRLVWRRRPTHSRPPSTPYPSSPPPRQRQRTRWRPRDEGMTGSLRLQMSHFKVCVNLLICSLRAFPAASQPGRPSSPQHANMFTRWHANMLIHSVFQGIAFYFLIYINLLCHHVFHF